ncbi:MAG: hypothetical protein ACYC55_06155 [Candidatus Geothermincolia bacterium]
MTKQADRARLWTGSIAIIGSGLLMFLSTFMLWSAADTGWSFMWQRSLPAAGGSANAFFYSVNGAPSLFTGIWSLALGLLIVAAGVLLMWSSGYGFRTFAMVLALLGLFYSIMNLVALGDAAIGVRYGAVIFLVSSSVALVGSALALPLLVVRHEEHPYDPAVNPKVNYIPERHGIARKQRQPEMHGCLMEHCID